MKIRRSQLITTWGVGNIADFPGELSGLIAGLDAWETAYIDPSGNTNDLEKNYIIHDERLEKLLNVKQFYLPMDYKTQGAYTYKRLPVIDFPRWKVCPHCGFLVSAGQIYHSDLNNKITGEPRCPQIDYANGPTCANAANKKGRKLLPVRFITYCDNGHIDDFPFDEWIDHDSLCNRRNGYRMLIGASADISAIKIVCMTCEKSRSMRDAFTSEHSVKKKCSGTKPWLGETSEECNSPLYAAIKGASKIYHPLTYSSLYLPPEINNTHISEIVDNEWNNIRFMLETFEDMGITNKNKRINGVIDKLIINNYSDMKQYRDDIFNYIEQKINIPEITEASDEFSLKVKEYIYLRKGNISVPELKISKIPSEQLTLYSITGLSEITKIRETIAFAGFTRGGFKSEIQNRPFQDKIRYMKKMLTKKPDNLEWLPAIVNYGEGMFFEFNESILTEWENRDSTKKRFSILEKNYSNSFFKVGGKNRIITPRFVFLHTFSHMLINRLAFISGYSCASIRERVFCDLPSHCDNNQQETMNGIMLYTAAGDSEGSLGGLVRQARQENLLEIIKGAIEQARWCSADPVCMESNGQGPDGVNLAACHNCVLLPETSCEFSNRLLDRALVVGSHLDPKTGFYSHLLE